ncbi:hypothetical protein K7432_013223 [Basidiobolus ranarum]|uniref:Major facilitator superfamily (MFS) profile domain-containing protein n=1 Tax=Basidiobolus ranarum TaxID=34480 RepID=A0ABR2VRJ9_9FUNG
MGFAWNIPWYILSASSPEQWIGSSSSDSGYNKELGQSFSTYTRVNNEDERDGFRQRSQHQDELEDGNEELPLPSENISGIENEIAPHPSAKYRGFISSDNTIPWNEILSSKEVWAILLNQFCSSWGFYVLLSWLPTYYKDVFDVDLNELGYFSVLPYIVQGLVGLASGFVGDYAINELDIPIITVRRIAQCTGMIGPAIFLLLAGYTATSVTTGMIYISLALGFNSLTLIGVSISQLDIAPKYAGIIFGLGNTAATLPGILGVTVTGVLLESKGAWPLVFGLAAIFYIAGALIWLFWGGGDRVVIN